MRRSQRFGDAAGSFAELALNRVGLLEIGMRRVEHERLPARRVVREQPLEPRVPPLRHARGDVDPFTLFRIEVDVEVLGLQDLKFRSLYWTLLRPKYSCADSRVRGDDNNDTTIAQIPVRRKRRADICLPDEVRRESCKPEAALPDGRGVHADRNCGAAVRLRRAVIRDRAQHLAARSAALAVVLGAGELPSDGRRQREHIDGRGAPASFLTCCCVGKRGLVRDPRVELQMRRDQAVDPLPFRDFHDKIGRACGTFTRDGGAASACWMRSSETTAEESRVIAGSVGGSCAANCAANSASGIRLSIVKRRSQLAYRR